MQLTLVLPQRGIAVFRVCVWVWVWRAEAPDFCHRPPAHLSLCEPQESPRPPFLSSRPSRCAAIPIHPWPESRLLSLFRMVVRRLSRSRMHAHIVLVRKGSRTAASRKRGNRMAIAVCIPKRDNRHAQKRGFPHGPEKHEHLCFWLFFCRLELPLGPQRHARGCGSGS